MFSVPVPNNLPPLGATDFIGHRSALERLHRELQQGGRVTVATTNARPGSGKTAFALQYALAHWAYYPGGICWIRAFAGRVEEQLLEFAKTRLKLDIPMHVGGCSLSLRQQIDWCWQHWQPEGQVLLIVDGAVELSSCRQLLLPPADRFRAIVTTANPQLVPRSVPLLLEGLSPEEAWHLLTSAKGALAAAETKAAQALCQWLDASPMALKLVGFYLARQPKIKVAQVQAMLERLESQIAEQPLALLPDSAATLSTAARRTQAVLELVWQSLDVDSQNVARLLSLFAIGIVPWSLVAWVLQALRSEEYDIEFARQQLEFAGLVEPADAAVEALELNPTVRAFFRQKLALEATAYLPEVDMERALSAALAGIARCIPQQVSPEGVEAFSPLVGSMAAVAQSPSQLSDENLVWPGMSLGRFYQALGLHSLAEPWWQTCLEAARERFGPVHADVAFSLNNLGLLYSQWGYKERAEGFYQQSLGQISQLFGENHSTFAVALVNLATSYQGQGRLDEAEVLYNQALKIEWPPEEEMLSKLTGLNNLAELYRAQGRYDDAEPIYQQSLALAYRLVGREHPTVAKILNNLAELYRAQGRYREAETYHMKALKMRQRLLGGEGAAIATSLNNLAELHSVQGHYRKAEKLYLQSLEMTKRTLGQDHPTYAVCLSNLAILYARQSRFGKATALLEQALTKQLRTLGQSHPETERTRQSLVNIKAAMH